MKTTRTDSYRGGSVAEIIQILQILPAEVIRVAHGSEACAAARSVQKVRTLLEDQGTGQNPRLLDCLCASRSRASNIALPPSPPKKHFGCDLAPASSLFKSSTAPDHGCLQIRGGAVNRGSLQIHGNTTSSGLGHSQDSHCVLSKSENLGAGSTTALLLHQF